MMDPFAWLKTVECPDPLSRAVLKELCGYADPLGVCWSPVPVLAFDLEKSDRMIQRSLRKLEAAGLIRKTGKFHHRNVPYYRLAVDKPGTRAERRARIIAGVRAEAAGRRRRAGENASENKGLNGDMGVTVEKLNGDAGATPNGDMGDTQQQRTTPSDGKPSSGRAGACASPERDVIRDRAFAAYPAAGRKGVSSKREWDEAWASEVAGGGDPADIETAAKLYAADKSLWGSSGKPVAAHTFLSRGRWADIADNTPAAGAAAAGGGAQRWTGPEEIRDQVAASGVRGAVGALDRCRWTGSAIEPPGAWSRDQLRAALRGSDVKVLDPAMARAVSGERG